MRLPEPLNASALLIDHDEHQAAAARRFLRLRDEAANLIRVLDIAREENEASRARLARKSPSAGVSARPDNPQMKARRFMRPPEP